MNMPRFDLMRNHIDKLRNDNQKDADFLKAVYSSAYGKGFYASHANNYAKTLID